MNPSEYYKRLIASITDSDVKRVAEVMAEHIGAENRISLPDLVRKTHLNPPKPQPWQLQYGDWK